MTHYTKEVEGMMNKFLDAEIKWVDIDNGLGKYMLASQVIEQAHKVFTEYQEFFHHQLQKAREESVKALEVADNDIPPFPSAKDSESARIGFITGVAWARTRLHSKLDQAELEGVLDNK